MTKKIQSRKNNLKTKQKKHNSRKPLMIGGANDTFVLVYNGQNYLWRPTANRHESGINEVNVARVIKAAAQKIGEAKVEQIIQASAPATASAKNLNITYFNTREEEIEDIKRLSQKLPTSNPEVGNHSFDLGNRGNFKSFKISLTIEEKDIVFYCAEKDNGGTLQYIGCTDYSSRLPFNNFISNNKDEIKEFLEAKNISIFRGTEFIGILDYHLPPSSFEPGLAAAPATAPATAPAAAPANKGVSFAARLQAQRYDRLSQEKYGKNFSEISREEKEIIRQAYKNRNFTR